MLFSGTQWARCGHVEMEKHRALILFNFVSNYISLQNYCFFITSHFSCKESKSFEMELETGGNTLEPFFHNSWTGNRVVARVTLHTRKDPGIMQQTILCCLHRTWIEPSTLDNGGIRPSTSSLENFSHEIVNRNTFPRHFRIFMLLVLSLPCVSYMYLWRLGIGTRLNMAADQESKEFHSVPEIPFHLAMNLALGR